MLDATSAQALFSLVGSLLVATILLLVEPKMPAEKRSAIQEVPYATASRTFVQVGRVFWRDEGVTGSAFTNLPIETVYRQPFEERPGPEDRAILDGYAKGDAASKYAARPENKTIRDVLGHMEKVHPGLRDHVEGTAPRGLGERSLCSGALVVAQTRRRDRSPEGPPTAPRADPLRRGAYLGASRDNGATMEGRIAPASGPPERSTRRPPDDPSVIPPASTVCS